ncbi:DEKNAAC100907 [Brettanomyces naardenensis]|uniref:Conserved oligomeric Golgi complex subunit 8 n=1 Tax=Brettanomyces naardenensis TaxID=13370 RepID=A0A448YEI8_BRENA|nr:DEKNAAC100907 [Brettanomyces naardenensis]
MPSATELLLDTLSEDLPDDIGEQIELGSDLRSESLQFLEDLLNEKTDAEVLLATNVRPSQDTENASNSLIERIAELDYEQRTREDKIKDETYRNLDLILKGNQTYKDCWKLFTNDLTEDCEYMVTDNKGRAEEGEEDEKEEQEEEEEEEEENEIATVGDKSDGAAEDEKLQSLPETIGWKQLLRQHQRQNQRIWRKKHSEGVGEDSSNVPSSTILQNMDSIMDILELPTLANACVKSGHYGECVEIASHVRRLSIRYFDIPLIQQVEADIQQEIKGMINGLIRLLNTDLKQGHVIKIITYLRRIGPFQRARNDVNDEDDEETRMSDEILERIFLKSRYQFILGELDSLEPLRRPKLMEKYLKRCIEVVREHCFQTIMTFESIFSSKNDGSARPVDLLLYSFIKSLVLRLCKTFRQELPALPDEASRNGLFLQLVYCSQSLGRVGGDFTPIVLKELTEFVDNTQWCGILKKQKELIRSMNRNMTELKER